MGNKLLEFISIPTLYHICISNLPRVSVLVIVVQAVLWEWWSSTITRTVGSIVKTVVTVIFVASLTSSRQSWRRKKEELVARISRCLSLVVVSSRMNKHSHSSCYIYNIYPQLTVLKKNRRTCNKNNTVVITNSNVVVYSNMTSLFPFVKNNQNYFFV